MIRSAKVDVSSLKSHIGYRLRVVSNAVSHSFAKALSSSDVTVAEWVVLREMYSENKITSSSKIADITGLTRGAVSKLIDRLFNKELISRVESPTDRRYQDIKLTTKGLKLVPRLAKIADDNDYKFFSILTEIEKLTLMKTLVKISEYHKLNTNPIE
ncbi:MarR family winged helix-turn-helix transcriptional regulator [Leptospira sp. GIMC2001]|uniref:MarR family winged helix-turn-helix transcriptional regulator n=1 Tax=Leptospira sp. GIMC2001 TaxID=1513297 RepID=UPI00234A87FA|nr:MarR family transcriptional regulator [Leptospira sp. GIMC2001]WCL50525.1 MarR family transcriptional regulator [Leptospira sp. GIMC2001]